MSRSLPAALALSVLIAAPAFAAPKDDAARIVASTAFKAATAVLDREHERTVQDIITLTEIPAPPFKEEARGKAYKAMLEAHGLTDVEIDAEGSVNVSRLPGTPHRTAGAGGFIDITARANGSAKK